MPSRDAANLTLQVIHQIFQKLQLIVVDLSVCQITVCESTRINLGVHLIDSFIIFNCFTFKS